MNWKRVPEKEIPEPFFGSNVLIHKSKQYYAVCSISGNWSLYLAKDFTLIAKHFDFDPPPGRWATDQVDLYSKRDKDIQIDLVTSEKNVFTISTTSTVSAYLTVEHYVPGILGRDLIPICLPFYLYIDEDSPFERIIAVRPHNEQ